MPSPVIIESDTGRYQASEKHLVITRRDTPRNATKTGIIHCHGYQSSPAEAAYAGLYDWRKVLWRAAAGGIPVMAIDAAGQASFGNAASTTALQNALTWFGANYGVRTDRIMLSGTSMGASVALNYWKNGTPPTTAAFIGFFPALDWTDSGLSSFATARDTAYTNNAGWLAAKSVRNPQDYASTITPPMHLIHSSGDANARSAAVTAFAAAATSSTVTTTALASAGAHITAAMTDAEIMTAVNFLLGKA
jgi:acetyl esterase/lipase